MNLNRFLRELREEAGDGTEGGGGGDAGSEGAGDAGTSNQGDSGSTDAGNSDAGSAPTLLAGKYKDQESLENGYRNLESRFGAFTGAPDAYADPEGMDTGMLGATLKEIGKDMQLSQEGYQSLYDGIVEMQDRVHNEQLDAVVESIPNFDTRRKAIVETAITKLRPDQMDALNEAFTSKESFEAMETLVAGLRGNTLPGSTSASMETTDSIMKKLNALPASDVNGRSDLIKKLNSTGGEGKLV